MTIDQASRIVGNQPLWCIRNMKKALELMPWANTMEEWQRLEAATIVLKNARRKQAKDRRP